MDPRERADAALARARARGAFVVTPDDAVSPMDAANTVQIPRAVVNAADGHDQPDSTMVIPAVGRRQQGYPPARGHQTGPHKPVPYPGSRGAPPSGGGPGGRGGSCGQHQSGQHQPVPYPEPQYLEPQYPEQSYPEPYGEPYPEPQHPVRGQYQSGQHQPVPPPPGAGRQEQAPQQRNPLFEEQDPTPRQLDGLVPTTHHPGTQRGTLSRRLDGH
jgi:hypothetical protein